MSGREKLVEITLANEHVNILNDLVISPPPFMLLVVQRNRWEPEYVWKLGQRSSKLKAIYDTRVEGVDGRESRSGKVKIVTGM